MRTLQVTPDPKREDAIKANSEFAHNGDPNFLVIDEPTLFVDANTGTPLGAYFHVDESMDELEAAVRTIRYGKTARTDGLQTNSRTFGYLPRVALRRDFCTKSSIAHDQPEIDEILTKWTQRASDEIRRLFPEQYEIWRRRVESEIHEDWRIPGSIFTTGIVNSNNRLAYHRDRGNFPESWNLMATFKRNCKGGRLAVPALGVQLECADRTFAIFNAQKYLHGVTEIDLAPGPKSWRYTIVWYTMRQLAHGLPQEEELARIRRVKVEREEARLLPIEEQMARLKGGRK